MGAMKRIAIYNFSDSDGIVDEFIPNMLAKLRPFVHRIVFVALYKLSDSGLASVEKLVDDVVRCERGGFVVNGYAAGLEAVGWEEIRRQDEVLFLDDSFFGPLYPFAELFGEMDKRDCDFWGLVARNGGNDNPFDPSRKVPPHLRLQFLGVRRKMLASSTFEDFWRDLPTLGTYNDYIQFCEFTFTGHFTEAGFKSDSYLDGSGYDSHDPLIGYASDLVARRCPILVRELFTMPPSALEAEAIDVRGALRLAEKEGEFDTGLVWKTMTRIGQARTYSTNANLLRIFPDHCDRPASELAAIGKIAVCVHMYYVDMLDEILDLASNIPLPFDFLATTDTEKKKKEIESALAGHPRIGKTVVRVMDQNRGRDMSALFICFRDIFLTDEYEIVCRLHTKKTPQVDAARGQLFKLHMFENVLNSPGYVGNVIDMFLRHPTVGVATPPVVHISFPTLGHSWFVNKAKVAKLATDLGLKVQLDDHTPVAVYGTMFWFRPKALRPLFARKWKFSEFNAEPHHVDGGLAHVLERTICYVAQNEGYTTQPIMCVKQAEENYNWLEFKYAQIMSYMPWGDLRVSSQMLSLWKQSDYLPVMRLMSLREACHQFFLALKREVGLN
jgi:lipopolysaccharide biosynthesis protein